MHLAYPVHSFNILGETSYLNIIMISLALTISSDGFTLLWLFQLNILIIRKVHFVKFNLKSKNSTGNSKKCILKNLN